MVVECSRAFIVGTGGPRLESSSRQKFYSKKIIASNSRQLFGQRVTATCDSFQHLDCGQVDKVEEKINLVINVIT